MFANQSSGRVVEFGEDPNGRPTARNLLTSLWAVVQGTRTHPYGTADADPSVTFNGLAQPAQNFRGLGPALTASAGVPYRNGGSPMIDSGLVEGPLGDPARRIFAQRMRRQMPMGGA